MAINWAQLVLAAGLGIVIGLVVYTIGVIIDKRREDRRLTDELSAIEKEFPTGG